MDSVLFEERLREMDMKFTNDKKKIKTLNKDNYPVNLIIDN